MANAIKELSTSPVLFVINPWVWAGVAIADLVIQGLKPKKPPVPELRDRTATIVASEAPHIYVYGRARVGSRVVAVLTSGARDEYKHIVCEHAAHECDAIEDVYINGKALGTLDANGDVTSGDYFKQTPTEVAETLNGTFITLAHEPINGTLRIFYPDPSPEAIDPLEAVVYTLAGRDLTLPSSNVYTIHYSYSVDISYVRVKKHLGAVSDTADATTIAEVPEKWTLNHKLTGHTYTIVRLDLNFKDFQNGLPGIEALLRGKKLHDVRDGSYPSDTPAWSQNPALILADYLTSEICDVPWTDLPLADFITAANVCDESTAFGALYQANGTVAANENQRQVLEKIAQSMAGTIEPNTWGITAGKYVAPVMVLTQADIVGGLSYTAGTPESELFNGVKGQYISSANDYVATDFEPYQNSTYVTADGAELWTDMDFPFTADKQRVHNLARIFTEDQRNGFALKADFSYKCWALKVGQRITFTSAFMGQTSKVYRVLGKSYAVDSAVSLTLKEDAATIWDLADAVTADSTPNTDLPSPFYVPPPGNVLVAEALYETTNSSGVKVKATVTWDAPADVNVLDYTIEYKRYEDPYFLAALYSSNTQVEIFDITSGRYDFRVSARNHLNLRSAWSTLKTATIYGLTTPPSDVTNFTLKKVSGVAVGAWDLSPDLDVRIGGRIVVRQSALTSAATWNDGYVIEEFNGDSVSGIMDLVTGTYMIKAKDSAGNYSENMVSFVLTEGMITGFTTVGTSTQAAAFTGAKTNVVVDGSALQLTDPSASLTGEYLFDTYMDLTTVATRRFESDITVYSFTTTDMIDSRTDLIDDWAMFDGGVINDTDVTLYAAVTNDDPAGTPTWSAWTPFFVSDFTCRAAKFKLDFSSQDVTHNIAVTTLTVHAKIPA